MREGWREREWGGEKEIMGERYRQWERGRAWEIEGRGKDNGDLHTNTCNTAHR